MNNLASLRWRVRNFFMRNNEKGDEVRLAASRIERLVDALEAREGYLNSANEECKRWMVYFHHAIRRRGVDELAEALLEGIWALLHSWAHEAPEQSTISGIDFLRVNKRTIEVDLVYPDVDPNPDAVEIDLMDVRSADGLRIYYDKERDGWVIQQASIFEFEADDKVMDPDWQEVAFVRAWARKKEHEE